jgi:hypothetical protein
MMHITVPRLLGLLMTLALIGYAFFIGPWITADGRARLPASSVSVPKSRPGGTARPTPTPTPTPSPSRTPTPSPATPSETAAPQTAHPRFE